MDLYASDYGKRICLVCGARLGKDLRHIGPPAVDPKTQFTYATKDLGQTWTAAFSGSDDVRDTNHAQG